MLIPTVLIPTILASWPLRCSVHINSVHMSSNYSYGVVPVPRKVPVYSQENTSRGFRGKYIEYTLKERAKMEIYASESSRPGLLNTSLSFRLQGTVLHHN